MGVVVIDLTGRDGVTPVISKIAAAQKKLDAVYQKTVKRQNQAFAGAGKVQQVFSTKVANTEAAIRKQIAALRQVQQNVTLGGQVYQKAGQQIDQYQARLNTAGAAATKKVGVLGRLRESAIGASQALAALGAGLAVKGFAQAGIEADRTAKRLKLLGDEYGETAALQKLAAEGAEKFTIGQTQAAAAVSDLFGRLRPAGVSLKDIETVFNGVGVAAAKMNLSASDVDAVMLQLSQALGAGVLNGENLVAVMERLPSIGNAIAKSMKRRVGELKELGAKGKLTTDVVIKGLKELSKQKPPEADAYKKFNKAMADLSTSIGKLLLPVLTPTIDLITKVVNAFVGLPEPVKAAVIGFTAVAGAFAVIGPLLPIIAAGLAAIVAVVTGPVGIVAAIGGAVAAFFAMKGATDETKKPVDEVNKKIDQTKIAVDAATEAKKRFIEKTKESLDFLTKEKTQIEAQKSAYQNTINVTNARLNAEKAINDLQGQILERAYEQASSATQRLNIAKQIFHNEVNGAKLAYQQTLNSIEAERGKLELKRQGAVIDAQILKARGAILVAETKGVEKKAEAQRQADKALDAQMQAVRLIDGQIKAQVQVGQHQATAAKAQLEAKIMTAEQNLKQKLVSKEINMSNTKANNLVTALGNGVRNTGDLATGTGQVAENARQSAHMFIQVANQASNAANQINRAATAQRNLNAARAQSSSSSNSGSTETAAAGAYWSGGFQAFAKGGMVKGPTLGLIGEGGEPEYIIPQSKAAGFAANFLSGKRGTSAIPGFADGGVVAPSSASVNIQTGPVTQMGGQNYVTMQDMSQAVQAGVEQTLQFLMSDGTVRAGVGLD